MKYGDYRDELLTDEEISKLPDMEFDTMIEAERFSFKHFVSMPHGCCVHQKKNGKYGFSWWKLTHPWEDGMCPMKTPKAYERMGKSAICQKNPCKYCDEAWKCPYNKEKTK